MDDYDVTCNHYGDYKFILENFVKFDFTQKQYNLLVQFHTEFKAFNDGPGMQYYLPKLFIDTPEWEKVMGKAKEVLQAFYYKKA
ncbi:MAG: hypothetical protein SP4CHLAM5_11410 [Chlamydiia bacterium]|nr:hypothetical protein [Chlamydiia bacterium]MCH9618997.1 hypothetical protein [Chlamydiia bacterium]MCH9624737.1 hypothetical protein [Chlamydiia bacterium]